jgi:hypothetical protein
MHPDGSYFKFGPLTIEFRLWFSESSLRIESSPVDFYAKTTAGLQPAVFITFEAPGAKRFNPELEVCRRFMVHIVSCDEI